MSSISAVLFDIDDTLFDRALAQTGVLRIMVRSCPEIFHALDKSLISEAFAESDRLTIGEFDSGVPSVGLRDRRSRIFLKMLGLPEDYAAKLSEIYVRELPEVKAPVAGAHQVVKQLSTQYRLGAVSNGLPDVQYRKLENLGLRGFFSCVVLSEEIGFRKPDARIFTKAARALQMTPAECLYVGDTYATDIVGAKNAGIQTCWFNRLASPPPLEEIMPDFVVKDLLEIPGVLKKMRKTRE